MSTPFADARAGLTNTASDARYQAEKVTQAIDEKKEDTAKTIEETLGTLKVMLGGKGISKGILADPIVKKYGTQLKERIVSKFKKAGNDALDEVQSRIQNVMRPPVGPQPNPAAVENNRPPENTLGETGDANVADAGTAADVDTAEADAADAAHSAKVAEQQSATDNFGRAQGERYDDWDTSTHANTNQYDDWDTPPEYEENEALRSGSTSAPEAAPSEMNQEVVPTGGDVGGGIIEDTGAEGAGIADQAARAAAAAAARAAGGAAAGEAGGDVALGLGETALAALDAIPIVDLFTAAVGIGLAAGAAAKKRPQDNPVWTANTAHVAFQAGLQNV